MKQNRRYSEKKRITDNPMNIRRACLYSMNGILVMEKQVLINVKLTITENDEDISDYSLG